MVARQRDFSGTATAHFGQCALQIPDAEWMSPVMPCPAQDFQRGFGQLTGQTFDCCTGQQFASHAVLCAHDKAVQQIDKYQGNQNYQPPPEKRVVLLQKRNRLGTQGVQPAVVHPLAERQQALQKAPPDKGHNDNHGNTRDFLCGGKMIERTAHERNVAAAGLKVGLWFHTVYFTHAIAAFPGIASASASGTDPRTAAIDPVSAAVRDGAATGAGPGGS